MENYAMMRNKRAFQNANPFPSTSSIGGVGSLHESVAQPTLRYFRPSASHCRTWNVSYLSILDKDPLVLQLRHIRAYKAMVSLPYSVILPHFLMLLTHIKHKELGISTP
jgi:hypothetical protein